MNFDPNTAALAVSILLLLQTFTSVLLWRNAKNYPGVSLYLLSKGLVMVSHFVILMAAVSPSPYFNSAVRNSLIILGHSVEALSILIFIGVRFPKWHYALWGALYLLSVALTCYWTFVDANAVYRIVLGSSFLSMVYFGESYWCFRAAPLNLRFMSWSIAFTNLIYGIFVLLRMMDTLGIVSLPWMDINSSQVLLHTYTGIAFFLTHAFFVLMVGQQMLRDSQNARNFSSSILEHLPLGIQIFDRDAEPLNRNQALAGLLATMEPSVKKNLQHYLQDIAQQNLQKHNAAVHETEHEWMDNANNPKVIKSLTFKIYDELQQVQHVVSMVEDISKKKHYERELERLVSEDSLTGILNRRTFEEALKREWQRASRYDSALSLVIIDFDRFKRVNDDFGHDVGDEVLRIASQLISRSLRRDDVFARYGGEEFVLLLAHCNAQEAFYLAERMRKEIQHHDWHSIGLPFQQTISLGIAEAKRVLDTEQFFQAADRALYHAKKTGRNRTIVAHTFVEESPEDAASKNNARAGKDSAEKLELSPKLS